MNRRLDVLFVHPGDAHKIYQGLSDKFTSIETPTWSLLLAQSCRAKGFGVAILDCDAERLTYEQAVDRIKDANPRLVCFTVYGQNPNSGTVKMTGAIGVAELLKKHRPDIKVCFVGSHVSALPRDVIGYPFVDLVLLNEGVYALHNLLKTDLETDLQNVKGIGWKENSGGVLNEPERVVPNELMDVVLPGSAWDLLPYKEKPFDLYRACNWHANYIESDRSPYAAVYTSLGCQFKCLRGDTEINTVYGKKSIKDLFDSGVKTVPVYTYSLDKKDTFIADAINISKTGTGKKLVRVEFDDGTHVDCTPDHKFLVKKSEEHAVEARHLKPEMRLRALKEIAVADVYDLDETDDVYCMEVPGYGWFFANDVLVKNCDFCMINSLNRTSNDENKTAADFNKMRFWSPEFITKEFEKLVEYGVGTVRISDEMFLLNKKYYAPLVQNMTDRGYGDILNCWAYSRVDTATPKSLGGLKKAGINWIALGVEAVDQKIRQEITKGSFKEVDIRRVIKDVEEAGMYTIANYIFGLPDDDYDTMGLTLDTALELNTETANFYPCFALPGSPLHLEARRAGTPLPQSFEAWSFHSYESLPLPTKYLSAAEVLRFRDRAWQTYFSRGEYQDKVARLFGTEAADNVRAMLQVKLKRKLLGD